MSENYIQKLVSGNDGATKNYIQKLVTAAKKGGVRPGLRHLLLAGAWSDWPMRMWGSEQELLKIVR